MNIHEVITDSLVETTSAFEDKNRAQMMAGKTKEGEPIGPKYRSMKYARVKQGMNSAPGFRVPDLRLTGEFHRLLDVDVGKNEFDIISLDDKGPALENKYPGIFGLGGAFKKAYLSEDLWPVLKGKIEGKTGLKFSGNGALR